MPDALGEALFHCDQAYNYVPGIRKVVKMSGMDVDVFASEQLDGKFSVVASIW